MEFSSNAISGIPVFPRGISIFQEALELEQQQVTQPDVYEIRFGLPRMCFTGCGNYGSRLLQFLTLPYFSLPLATTFSFSPFGSASPFMAPLQQLP